MKFTRRPINVLEFKKNRRYWPYLLISLLFLIIAWLDALRIILGIDSRLFGFTFPMWLSGIILVFAIYFAYRSFVFCFDCDGK
ncbi:MAG: hypothetical protein WC250_01415 [Candidatus Paceibacterota bacterium]|jgi:hypothetical protein